MLYNFNEFILFTNITILIYYIIKKPCQVPWIANPMGVENINEIVIPQFNLILLKSNLIMGAIILICDFFIKKHKTKKANN
ncbi:hypothetical protein MYP_658 [Sporocytophaga myxococcoides]|uniref:Uncharacterized protein n=1 Tax=Sporocytophaga myxococcoides TaxID=153721 RepID=A0A098L967_9BACT|nr:hypothetical protein MYP_658 [Sporocytophaga myxococcoides]